MKYDVYETEDTVKVYKQGLIPANGEIPVSPLLHECNTVDEAWDWCDENGMDIDKGTFRVNRLCSNVSIRHIADLRNKAQERLDRYRAEGRIRGWGELEIDHSGTHYTFRSSAAWKDEPIRYTFEQPLKWTDKKHEDETADAIRINNYLHVLWGMSLAVYELGFCLVFDEDFKVHVMGVDPTWESKFDF